MRSSARSKVLDLERDLPTTAEDVAALRQVRKLLRLDLDGYLLFLAQLPPSPAVAGLLPKRPPTSDLVFKLVR